MISEPFVHLGATLGIVFEPQYECIIDCLLEVVFALAQNFEHLSTTRGLASTVAKMIGGKDAIPDAGLCEGGKHRTGSVRQNVEQMCARLIYRDTPQQKYEKNAAVDKSTSASISHVPGEKNNVPLQ